MSNTEYLFNLAQRSHQQVWGMQKDVEALSDQYNRLVNLGYYDGHPALVALTEARRAMIAAIEAVTEEIGTLSAAIDDARRPQPEQDSCNPAKKDCIRVGKYTRATDPSIVERLREDGYNTSNENIGLYVLESDPDMFDNLLRSGAC